MASSDRRSGRLLAAALITAAVLLMGPGLESTVARSVPDAQDPARIGRWALLPDEAPITPINGALLRTGKVLLIAGSGNDRDNVAAGDFESVVWDPETGDLTEIPTPWDAFCSGDSFLANGKLLIAGGAAEYPTLGKTDWKGSKKAYLFDPIAQRYEPLADMANGRWYPTVVTLGSGHIYTMAGQDETGLGMATTPEVYDPGADSWSPRPVTPVWPMYPALFLLHGGRLFYSGGNVFGRAGIAPGILNVSTSKLTAVAGLRRPKRRNQSASVLLPPAQQQRVMIIGGAGLGKDAQSIRSVDIIDLKASTPRYRPGAAMRFPRMYVNALLLPDRTVLVTGGGGQREARPVYKAEIYDPASNSWSTMAAESVARLYHSLSVLLPDGRVLVAGSNPDGYWEHRLEVFSPPYLFKGRRPVIRRAPREITYGSTFRIHTTQARDVRWVQLIRPSTVTHSTNTEQRVVAVKSRWLGHGALKLTVTDDRTVAPPGWYMLFVTNRDGIPSVAKWVHLG